MYSTVPTMVPTSVSTVLGKPPLRRFGYAKVNDLGDWLIVIVGHHHVGRFLRVAVDDPLLVCMLYRIANALKEC